jgi:hypothetical protein
VPDAAVQPELAGGGVRRLKKSRYASISHYIYDCPVARQHGKACPIRPLNDLEYEVDPEMLALLKEGGIDDMLARHVAYNFSRDPLVMFKERLDIDDETETDHFESLQSSNWNTVRWKPPPAMDSPIGWRTEFRPMEVQLTDYENAAFTVITMLLTRALLAFDLDLLIPISQVDENMRRAHARDAVLEQKFHFRKHLASPCPSGDESSARPQQRASPCGAFAAAHEVEEMSIGEVLNGKGDYYPGLLPLCGAYLDSIECDAATRYVPPRALAVRVDCTHTLAVAHARAHPRRLPGLSVASASACALACGGGVRAQWRSSSLHEAGRPAREWHPAHQRSLAAQVCHVAPRLPRRLGGQPADREGPDGGCPRDRDRQEDVQGGAGRGDDRADPAKRCVGHQAPK